MTTSGPTLVDILDAIHDLKLRVLELEQDLERDREANYRIHADFASRLAFASGEIELAPSPMPPNLTLVVDNAPPEGPCP
jgi:hypothetical protein